MAFDFIRQALESREREGLLRKVTPVSQNHDGIISFEDAHLLNFAGNDYLGLSQHPDVLQAYTEGLSLYGASSTASPLVCGYHKVHQALEEALCELTHQSGALLFSSGFAANQALCQALCTPSPTTHNSVNIIADKLMHASFVEAATTNTRSFSRFRHNDTSHARKLVANHAQTDTIVASEGVFSMDGDCAPVSELSRLAKQNAQVWLMLDQAHAIGVIGEQGCGLETANHYSHVNVVMGTFGKALGTQGAFIAGPSSLIAYLHNYARHYIYSTSISPALALATHKSLTIMQEGTQRHKLTTNIQRFKALAQQHGIALMPSDSAIQPIMLNQQFNVVTTAKKLRELGILVGAIRSPTVPNGKERLRLTISALHTEKDMLALVEALNVVREQTDPELFCLPESSHAS